MKGDRWCELRTEARPKARKFAKTYYRLEQSQDVAEGAYMRGYFAGATRNERRGPAARKRCTCSDGGCSECYAGPVTQL